MFSSFPGDDFQKLGVFGRIAAERPISSVFRHARRCGTRKRWPPSSRSLRLCGWYRELQSQVGKHRQSHPQAKSLQLYGRYAIGAAEEVRRVEKAFLLATRLLTPFIGLFGTVWGIIEPLRPGSAALQAFERWLRHRGSL